MKWDKREILKDRIKEKISGSGHLEVCSTMSNKVKIGCLASYRHIDNCLVSSWQVGKNHIEFIFRSTYTGRAILGTLLS